MKFATCVLGSEQRVARSIFQYIIARFSLVLTTINVAFVSATASPLKGSTLGPIDPMSVYSDRVS